MQPPASPEALAAQQEFSRWLTSVTDDPGPFELERLPGGQSNETWLVTSQSSRIILRRPPAANVDPRASSVEREYRVLIALADTHVPVPRPIAFSISPLPDGVPLLLMEYVDGVALTDRLPAAYGDGATTAIGHAAIDTLVDVHALPWRELWLTDYGRPEQFLERQVRRWEKQYRSYRHRELPDFAMLAAWLEEHRPEAGEPTILHGDFHIDNLLFGTTGPPRLMAVIDWELSTIGDPLLDVGLLLALWGADRAEPLAMPFLQAFSRTPGAPTRAELAERYARRSGRSLDHLNYYMVLALWKFAAVVEGAHLHFTSGRVTTDFARSLSFDVPRLLAEARLLARRGPQG